MTKPAPFSPRGTAPRTDVSEVGSRLTGWRGFRQRMIVSRRGSRLLVLTCLFVSIMVFNYAIKYQQLHAQLEFRKLTMGSVGSINMRIGSYAQVLSGTAAYFGVQAEKGITGFEHYISLLDLKENAPGTLGIGFVRSVSTVDIPMLERELTAQYRRPVSIHSPTDFDEKMIVTHMAPQLGNEGVIGLDKGFEEGRRAALLLARESRETVLARRLPLVHDESAHAGLLMVRAVYTTTASDAPSETVEDVFQGWVIAPFGARDALEGVTRNLGTEYQLTIYQGTEAAVDRAMFTSKDTSDATGAFTQYYPVEQYGSAWLLRYDSTPRFDAAYKSFLPHVLLILGLLFTVVVASALKSSALRHRAIKTVAELRARELGARAEENRSLVETSVSVVLVLDDAGSITFANEGVAALFGIQSVDFLGRDFSDFVRFGHGERQSDLCNAVGLLVNGDELLLDVQTNRWHTVSGTTHTTVLIRDVTEQINGRMAIEALNQRYEVALVGAGIGIFEIDTVTDHTEMSKTWHKMMGTHGRNQPFDRKKDFMMRVHPDDLSDVVAAYRTCITGGAERSIVEYRMQVDGRWRWMYSNAIPVARGADGQVTKLIGAQTDITDLREARSALELSEARFRMVLEDAPVGMAVMNEVGTFIGVNAALARLSGYEVDALRNKMRLAEVLLRKDFVTLSRDVRDLLKSGESKTYQNQFRLRTRSGELRWGLFNLSWTFDQSLGENVYIAQIIDITNQKRVEQIKSEFVATVSHELRTPLTSIKGALGLLRATAAEVLPDSAKRLLDIASVNADRLTSLVNDILDLERISSGEVIFEFETVALNDTIAHCLAEMDEFAAQHGNSLLIGSQDMSVHVHVDAGRMRQVLRNLISNACKFSDDNTAVVVRIDVQGDMATVLVENTGPPVPESFQSQIFDAFTQVDGSDTRQMGGTGLGLNIARQIVMRLGGRIGFEQQAERCTVFWFTCPLALGEVADAPEDREWSHG